LSFPFPPLLLSPFFCPLQRPIKDGNFFITPSTAKVRPLVPHYILRPLPLTPLLSIVPSFSEISTREEQIFSCRHYARKPIPTTACITKKTIDSSPIDNRHVASFQSRPPLFAPSPCTKETTDFAQRLDPPHRFLLCVPSGSPCTVLSMRLLCAFFSRPPCLPYTLIFSPLNVSENKQYDLMSPTALRLCGFQFFPFFFLPPLPSPLNQALSSLGFRFFRTRRFPIPHLNLSYLFP